LKIIAWVADHFNEFHVGGVRWHGEEGHILVHLQTGEELSAFFLGTFYFKHCNLVCLELLLVDHLSLSKLVITSNIWLG
jgi:hypothetical protein